MEAQERWYRQHLPLERQRIVDVGANVGQLSQFFWDAGARTNTVISIEPIAENAKAIEKRIRAARATNRWTVKRCAVSARDGQVTMRVVQAAWGVNAVVVPSADASTITVACRRLETLVPDATVVKIDVEGHEYAFLAAAVEAMPNVVAWALELHGVEGHPLEETLQLFAERGYRLIGAAALANAPKGEWVDVELSRDWSWQRIGGVPSMRDGLPSTYYGLHLLALK